MASVRHQAATRAQHGPATAGRWSFESGRLGAGVELANQLIAIGTLQGGAEPKDVIRYVSGFEVGVAALHVNEAARGEPAFLVKHDADAPASFLDGLMTAAALRLSGRRALGAVDALHAFVSEALAGHAFEAVPIGDAVGCLLQGFQKCLGKLAGGAWRVEPQSGIAVGKQIGNTCAEAQLPFLDGAATSTALGAAAAGGFEHVGHERSILDTPHCWGFYG